MRHQQYFPSIVHLSSSSMAASASSNLRVVFIPFFANGHMLAMVDLARLFAARSNVQPIMAVTPANADLIQPVLDSSAADGLHIGLLLYPFPFAESGLPPGKENLSSLSAEEEWRIYVAVDKSRAAHRRLLRDHHPDAVIADVPYYWITAMAAELGIPRVTFHPVGTFPQCVMQVLHRRPLPPEIGNNPFVVPELPGEIELVRSELPGFLRETDHLTHVWGEIRRSQLDCFGVVVNTFYEFEPEYCDWYRKNECPENRAWFVGPVTLSYGRGGAAERGGADAVESWERCRRWLDEKEEGSVVFVCLGSWYSSGEEQLREMALGLEDSGRPFLWVVRGCSGEEWLPAVGWEERVGKRGMVVRGWAPQVPVLNHRAVGAFISHCGWNSVMESTAAGVPIMTWPLVFEQFINERLVTEVQGTGKRVWNGFRSTVAEEKEVVPRSAIAAAVKGFMEAGGAGNGARKRMKEYAEKARTAMSEGGSSRKDVDRLINDLRGLRRPPEDVAAAAVKPLADGLTYASALN